MTDIILINGSLNPSSNTRKILTLINDQLTLMNAYSSEIMDVSDLNLPLFNPSKDNTEFISYLLDEMHHAKAFIIGAPEYHGGYPGALKNFLDYLNRDVFKEKPVGLVVSTGGIKSGQSTLSSLRLVLRNLHSHVIPQQVAISEKELTNNRMDHSSIQRVLQVMEGLLFYLELFERKSNINRKETDYSSISQ